MQHTRWGSSGPKVSRIGLGMMSNGDPTDEAWFLSDSYVEPIVRHAARLEAPHRSLAPYGYS